MKQMMFLTMNDTFPEALTGKGIFSSFSVVDFPFMDGIQSYLDIMYFTTHSGEKLTSKLVHTYLNEDNEITDEGRLLLAELLTTRWKNKWNGLWDTLNFEYNPIENYDMKENETVNRNGEISGTEQATNNSTLEGTSGSTTTTNSQGTVENNISVYGFNSQTGVNSDKENKTSNNTVSVSGTQNVDNTSNETKNISSHEEKTDAEVRELTRHGNIGATTTQRMIQQERAVRNYDFVEQLFKDIDLLLTIPIY